VIVRGLASPAQRSVHDPAPVHARLHEDVQVTAHVAPFLQTTLLLAPTVAVQLAASQSTFELWSVSTVQVLPVGQSTLQESVQPKSHEPLVPQS